MLETAPNLEVAPVELSIVMPCLNEAATLGICIRKAQGFLSESGIVGEVIVGDNGSVDGSVEIARECGAKVVRAKRKGYGVALMACIEASRGEYILMGDSDNSYDFSALAPFVEELRKGADLVMGNRFRGGIHPGAMPTLHRYIGNPILTRMARFLFKAPIGDVYCGLRGFRKSSIEELELQSPGMEFALEMVVKSTLTNLRITEVPTTLSPDGRARAPHLKTWRDGRRSLRFFLFCSPQWLFFYPGIILILLGAGLGSRLMFGPVDFMGFHFDSHTLLYCTAAMFLGFQAIFFAVFAKTLAISVGLLPHKPSWERVLANTRIEYGILVGGILILIGLVGSYYGFHSYSDGYNRASDPFEIMRTIIPSVFLLTLGAEVIFSVCYLSLLKVHFKRIEK
jgi:glycosyltransferase involved in cell wall biosynthesis